MPAQYERIKESYLKRGKPPDEAKRLAAMTYNAHRKSGVKPVTRNYDEGQSVQRKRQMKRSTA